MPNPHITQIAVAIVLDNDRVLIGQRPAGVALAGLWEFPGGKIEAGETPAAAACRESLEETGLVVTACETLQQTQHTYGHGTVELHFIACQPHNTTTTPAPPFRWVKRQELNDYEFPAANAHILQLLLQERWQTGFTG